MMQARANTARAFGQLARKARNLVNSLGYRVAAGYLRNREIPFEEAYMIIFNKEPRHG